MYFELNFEFMRQSVATVLFNPRLKSQSHAR